MDGGVEVAGIGAVIIDDDDASASGGDAAYGSHVAYVLGCAG